MVPRPRHGLSLCAGAGGLDMGLMLAEPGFHTRCFAEWEPYPRSAIIAAQRAGYFAPAPIWDDVSTFDGKPLRGAIDTVLAGYPCQPFSMAGQRKGADDERHLWPDVARIIGEIGPRWVFLENVAGHLTLGLEAVLRELWGMGYTPAVGLFSAEEVGAPHERQRVFIVAYSHGQERRPDDRHPDAGADGRHDAGGRGGDALVHAGSPGRRSGDGCSELGNAAGIGRGEGRAEPSFWVGRDTPASTGGAMANAISGTGHKRGASECASGAGQNGDAPDRPFRHGAGLFPPSPGDHTAWADIVATDPSSVPATARRDAKSAALRLTALLDPIQAESIERDAGRLAFSDILAEVGKQARGMVGEATAFAGFRDLAHGLAQRPRALRLLGNGVVPLEAAYAWRTLAAAHGLGPVDLEAAGRNAPSDTMEPV